MTIHIDKIGTFPPVAGVTPAIVKKAVKSVFKSERTPLRSAINIVFVDGKTIIRLNRQFLNEKGLTDVIAFPYESSSAHESKLLPFGDVYVCVPVAIDNARRFGDTAKRELVRLVIHGTLHLFGYTDHGGAAKKKMWAKQEKLVNLVCNR